MIVVRDYIGEMEDHPQATQRRASKGFFNISRSICRRFTSSHWRGSASCSGDRWSFARQRTVDSLGQYPLPAPEPIDIEAQG